MVKNISVWFFLLMQYIAKTYLIIPLIINGLTAGIWFSPAPIISMIK